jgi:HD-like signal output (HDOD) protein
MQLADLLQQPHALPVAPEVAARLIATFDQEDVDLGSIALIIQRDPALAATVLRQANSSFFRLLRPVATVQDAVMVLGLNKVRALVISAALNQSFHAISGVNLEAFWQYSLAAAALARVLSAQRGLDENIAFTTALLHGMGELVMHMGMPEWMHTLDERVPMFKVQRAEVQYQLLGYSYAEVGAALAAHWRLPREMAQAIEQHTRPIKDGQDLSPLPAVVHMAVWRACVWASGNRQDDLIHTYPDGVGLLLDLDPDTLVQQDLPVLRNLQQV